MNKHQRTL